MRSRFTKKDFKPYLTRVTAMLLNTFSNATNKGDNSWVVQCDSDSEISYEVTFYDYFIYIAPHYMDAECKGPRKKLLLDYFEEVRTSTIFSSVEKMVEHGSARSMEVGHKWNIQGASDYLTMEHLFSQRLADMSTHFPIVFRKWLEKQNVNSPDNS